MTAVQTRIDTAYPTAFTITAVGGVAVTARIRVSGCRVKYLDPDGREDVYFLYVYNVNITKDQKYQKFERSSINEEVALLRTNGYSVKVVEHATKQDIINAFSDAEAQLIVTSGHGNPNNAAISTADGLTFSAADVPDVSTTLRTVIFENCHQGKPQYKQDWSDAFGAHVEVVGWPGITTTTETRRFNNSGIFDRQPRRLNDYVNDVIRRGHTYVEQPI